MSSGTKMIFSLVCTIVEVGMCWEAADLAASDYSNGGFYLAFAAVLLAYIEGRIMGAQ